MDHGIRVPRGNLYCSEVARIAPEISLRCQVMFHLRINFVVVKIPNISTTKRVVDFLQEYRTIKLMWILWYL